VTDPATTMLPTGEPGTGWFEPPLEATTKLAIVDRRPSPVPRTPPPDEPDEPAAVRPYVADVDEVEPESRVRPPFTAARVTAPVYRVDPAPSPRVELGPLRVEITRLAPEAIEQLVMALRHLLYEQPPTDGRLLHGERRRDPAPLFAPDLPAGRPSPPAAGGDTTTGLLCSTPGCSQTAGHPPPCDQSVAGDEDEQEAASWH
jgi:hypothetical protein